MAYKCDNTECSNYNKVVNPGGTIVIKGNKPFYTGSICKICKEPMKHIANKMGYINNIKNPGDGRNL